MPEGKSAGEVCANLDKDTLQCKIWGSEHYPDWCKNFQAEIDFCGASRDEALQILRFLERSTN